jgi:hypothetical protein
MLSSGLQHRALRYTTLGLKGTHRRVRVRTSSNQYHEYVRELSNEMNK